jgi:two-component system, sensor histidine kinase PdtaS
MNTLQILSSLIGLESEVAQGDAAAVLRELDGRVQSMALVHEAINTSEGGDEVDFKRYVELYCDRFADSSLGRGSPLRIVRGADAAVLPIDKALPFGLILNELVSRAARRLARVEAVGAIRVELRSTRGGKALKLSVGAGAGGDPGASGDPAALGTRLVDGLAGQLRAALAESTDGSSVSVEFSLE